MMSMPQHAMVGCTEMIEGIAVMQGRVMAAKRLRTLEEMQVELAALQMELGGLKLRAVEMKTFVGAAFMTTSRVEVSDVIPAARMTTLFPAHAVAPQPMDYQMTIPE